MSCLIVSDQIRVQLNAVDVALPVDEVTSYDPYGRTSSIQRPDMSRMRLRAMLRRSVKPTTDGARLTWATMLNRRKSECANSN